MFVGGGSDDASRFIEHEVDFFGGLERPAMHFDAIGAKANGSFRIFRSAPVEPDFALAD